MLTNNVNPETNAYLTSNSTKKIPIEPRTYVQNVLL